MFKIYDVMNLYFFPEEGNGNAGEEVVEEEEVVEDPQEDPEEETDEEKAAREAKEADGKEAILTRADFAQLKKDYPGIDKKYPGLREAFFREQAFTEIFPTVEEANNALAQVSAYEEITETVVNGDAEKFVSQLSEHSATGVKKFATNFLPAIQKMSNDLYLEICTPVVDKFIRNVYSYGKTLEKEEDRKNVMAAAKIVRKMLVGGDYEDIDKESKLLMGNREPSEEEKKVEEQRAKMNAEAYGKLFREVQDTAYTNLQNTIMAGLDDLKDNKGLQRMATKEIMNKILAEMDKDTVYTGRIAAMWKREHRNGFSGTLKPSIITAFMGKAKGLIPKYRAEVRKDLNIKGKKSGSEEEKEATRISGGRTGGEGTKKMTPQIAKEKGLTSRQVFD